MKVKTKSDIHEFKYDEYAHQNLEANKIYEIIGISYDYYRVINKNKEPVLYPKYLFEVIDPNIPEHWFREEFEEDEYYVDPPELSKQGFYEAFFDHKKEAIETFWRVIKENNIQY